jgi:hypothetical protein
VISSRKRIRFTAKRPTRRDWPNANARCNRKDSHWHSICTVPVTYAAMINFTLQHPNQHQQSDLHTAYDDPHSDNVPPGRDERSAEYPLVGPALAFGLDDAGAAAVDGREAAELAGSEGMRMVVGGRVGGGRGRGRGCGWRGGVRVALAVVRRLFPGPWDGGGCVRRLGVCLSGGGVIAGTIGIRRIVALTTTAAVQATANRVELEFVR